jgi:anti-sigma B factor antagonist
MFDVELLPDATILSVTTDIDIANADGLWSAIELEITTRHRPIVVSLQDCPYCDSTGLSVFVRAAKRFDGQFALHVPPSSQCARILDLTGLSGALPIYPSLDLIPQLSNGRATATEAEVAVRAVPRKPTLRAAQRP